MSFTNECLKPYQKLLRDISMKFKKSKTKRKMPSMKDAQLRMQRHTTNPMAMNNNILKYDDTLTEEKVNNCNFDKCSCLPYTCNLFTEVCCMLSEFYPMSRSFEMQRSKGTLKFLFTVNDLSFIFYVPFLAQMVYMCCKLLLDGWLPFDLCALIVDKMTSDKTKSAVEASKRLKLFEDAKKKKNKNRVCRYFLEGKCHKQKEKRCRNGLHKK